jgi:hypothetical protein
MEACATTIGGVFENNLQYESGSSIGGALVCAALPLQLQRH